MVHLSWALFTLSLLEWFWLVELLSVLRSGLIGVRVGFSRPAGSVPQGRVHHIARAIILQALARAVQVLFVLHVLVELNRPVA